MSIQSHGTRTRYDKHQCRCGLCRAANAKYERDRRAGVRLSVPAGEVRARLNALLDLGWTYTGLAAHIGYDRGVLRNIATGRTQWTTRLTAEDILSVPVRQVAA